MKALNVLQTSTTPRNIFYSFALQCQYIYDPVFGQMYCRQNERLWKLQIQTRVTILDKHAEPSDTSVSSYMRLIDIYI